MNSAYFLPVRAVLARRQGANPPANRRIEFFAGDRLRVSSPAALVSTTAVPMSDLAVPERRRLSVSRRQRSDAARGFPVPTSPVGDAGTRNLRAASFLCVAATEKRSRSRTSGPYIPHTNIACQEDELLIRFVACDPADPIDSWRAIRRIPLKCLF